MTKEANLKRSDYVVQRGIEKVNYKRGLDTDDGSTNLTVQLEKNHNKGLIRITAKLDNAQINSDDKINQSIRATLSGLIAAVTKDAKKWRDEWKKENSKKDQGEPIPGLE